MKKKRLVVNEEEKKQTIDIIFNNWQGNGSVLPPLPVLCVWVVL